MDFRDSPAEASFRSDVRAFLDAHAPRGGLDLASAEADENGFLALSRTWQRTLFDNGWAALTWPKAVGGRGLGPIEQIIWNQELARRRIGESVFVVGIGMAGPTLIAHGSEEQKARLLPPMLRGDEIWCQLFSEPGAGSDLAAVATRAVREGDDWILSGQKTWCSGGHYAAFGICLARTDPSVPKHKGLSYFLVDMRAPGIDVRPLRQMSGGSHFNEVFLDGVRVPDSMRVGPVGGGWSVAMTTLMNERMAIGGIERMFSMEELAAAARARRDRLDPLLRDDLALLWCRVRSLELLNARVLTKLSRGAIPMAESSVMKLAIARILSQAGEIGLRLEGADALLGAGRWQHQFLFAPSIHIAGGTDEIQKNVAAERVLGLPREPGNDREIPFERLPRSGPAR